MELQQLRYEGNNGVMEEDEFEKWKTYGSLIRLLWPIGDRWIASLFRQRMDQGLVDAMFFAFSDRWVRLRRERLDGSVSKNPKIPRRCEINTPSSLNRSGKYRYQPLPSDSHIRLLYILPGTDCSVRFSTVLLSDAPPFETLSYVWGSQDSMRYIDVEGSSFEVGENLYGALCALRLGGTERCFWIDALCINQSDLRERSTQVSMMPKIYTASQKTTVWLGADATISGKTVELLNMMGRDHVETPDVKVTSEEEVWGELGKLYTNPWFYRVWIIQEVAMAQEIIVLLNEASWPWDVFVHAAYNALTRGIKFQAVFDPESILRLERIRAGFKNQGPAPTILQVLAIGRKSLATLDVDKVYGLLGLSAEQFEVNYEESTDDTYLRLAKMVVDKGGATMLLNYVDDHSFRFGKRLPSWVPDWEVRQGARPLLDTPAAINWDASNGGAPHAGLGDGGRHLRVHGFVLDTLDRIGDWFKENVPLAGAPRRVAGSFPAWIALGTVTRRVSQWRTLAMKHGTMFPTENARYDAYVSTLTAGNSLSGGTQVPGDNRGYKLWCKVWFETSRMDFDTILSAYDEYDPEELVQAAGFMQLHIHAGWGRRLYTTQHYGIMGLCPSLARRGDLLVIIHGGKTPYIIRKAGNGRFRFIGECYAHAFMHGEAEGWKKDRKTEEFILV